MRRLLCGLLLAATLAPATPATAAERPRVLACTAPVSADDVRAALARDTLPTGCDEAPGWFVDWVLCPIFGSMAGYYAFVVITTEGDVYFGVVGLFWDCPPYET